MVTHYNSFDEYISAHGKAEELKFKNFKDVKPEKKAEPKKKKATKNVQTD